MHRDDTNFSGTTLTSTEPLGIGALKFTGYLGNHFDGDLDEMRLWSVARTAVEIARDRNREISSAPGLIAAFHFDEIYKEAATGERGFLGSRTTAPIYAAAQPSGVSSIESGLGGAPLLPDFGIDLGASAQLTSARTYPDALYFSAAALGDGYFAATATELGGTQFTLEIHRALGATIQSVSSIVIALPMALAAGGGLVFVTTGDEPTHYLSAYSVSNPATPALIGSPIAVDFDATVALVDPFPPQRLWLAGVLPEGPGQFRNRVALYETSGSFDVLLYKDLGHANAVGQLVDLAVVRDIVAISFTNGYVRTYLHTAFGDPVVHDLLPLDELFVGTSVHLAGIPGTEEEFLFAGGGIVGVMDAYPSQSQVIASAPLSGGPTQGINVSGTRAYVACEDGLRVLDIRPTYPLDEVAWFVSDHYVFDDPSIDVTTGNLYLAAGRAGMYSLVVNSVLAAEEPVRSNALRLWAHPNPLRESATIMLRLARPALARVELFDVAGRRIRQLVSADLPAGEHALPWDGREDDGQPVPPGLYLCRATLGSDVETLRLLRVR